MTRLAHGLALVWGLTCALTIASVGFVESGWRGELASIVVVLLAAAKSRLVIVHYMEARRAARHWRMLYEGWNVVAAGAIIAGLLVGAPG